MSYSNQRPFSCLSDEGFSRPVPRNQWTHLGLTWNRETAEARFFINGIWKGTQAGETDQGGIDLMKNDHSVYDIGFKRDTDSHKFHGHLREFLVFRKALSQEELVSVKSMKNARLQSGAFYPASRVSYSPWRNGRAGKKTLSFPVRPLLQLKRLCSQGRRVYATTKFCPQRTVNWSGPANFSEEIVKYFVGPWAPLASKYLNFSFTELIGPGVAADLVRPDWIR